MHVVLRFNLDRRFFPAKKINFVFINNLNYSNGKLPGFKV